MEVYWCKKFHNEIKAIVIILGDFCSPIYSRHLRLLCYNMTMNGYKTGIWKWPREYKE